MTATPGRITMGEKANRNSRVARARAEGEPWQTIAAREGLSVRGPGIALSLLGEYLDLAVMKQAADEERAPAPVRVAGDGGRATPAQIKAEQIFRDVADSGSPLIGDGVMSGLGPAMPPFVAAQPGEREADGCGAAWQGGGGVGGGDR